jgi:hypothetical protein
MVPAAPSEVPTEARMCAGVHDATVVALAFVPEKLMAAMAPRTNEILSVQGVIFLSIGLHSYRYEAR